MNISFVIAMAGKVIYYSNQECKNVDSSLIYLTNFPWALSMCQMLNIH